MFRLPILFKFFLCLLGSSSGLWAQGLTGSDLAPVNDAQAGLSGLLGQLAGGQLAVLGKVTVSADDESRLVLQVRCTSCADRKVQVELRDRNRQRLAGILSAAKSIEGGLELTLSLDPALSEGSVIEAAQLQIRLLNPQFGVPEAEGRYLLPKKWQMAVRPENVVVRVPAIPIGAAASLPANPAAPTTLPPPRTLKVDPQRQILLKNFTVLTEPATARPDTVQPAPTQPAKGSKQLQIDATMLRRVDTPPPAAVSKQGLGTATTSRAATLDKTSLNQLMLSNQELVVKTQPAAQALKRNPDLLRADSFHFGVKPEDQNKGALGPSANRLWLFESLRSDSDIDPREVANIWPEVFRDANEASGIFYFLPQAYHLEWNADDGYGFTMLYAAATAEGAAGEVLMAARLDSGVDLGEIEVARALLDAYRGRHAGIPFSELRPLSIAQPPQVSLAGGLARQFEIPPEKIALNALSDALGQLDISWSTDTVTKENLQLALVSDAGLNGNLTFTAAGGGESGALTAQIPVEIRIATPGTFGTLKWSRTAEIRNRTPYPLRLKNLRALRIVDNQPVVLSWSLGETEVPPLAKIEIDAARIPGWLDSGAYAAKRWWVSYAVKADCEACDRQVIASITRGVVSLGTAQIVFRALRPLEDLGAAEIVLKVRSRFFDPNDRTPVVKSDIVLGEDNREYQVGPIYVAARDSGVTGSSEPLFEYQLSVTYADGTVRESPLWIPCQGLRIPIGKKQVEEALGMTNGGSP